VGSTSEHRSRRTLTLQVLTVPSNARDGRTARADADTIPPGRPGRRQRPTKRGPFFIFTCSTVTLPKCGEVFFTGFSLRCRFFAGATHLRRVGPQIRELRQFEMTLMRLQSQCDDRESSRWPAI